MRILGTVALALVLVACSGSSSSPSTTTTGQLSEGITEACNAAMRCTAGSTITSTTLRRDASGAGCVLQGVTLLPGGGVEGNAEASWTADAESVRVCQGESCFTCEPSDGTPANSGTPSPKKKACKGYSSCPSYPPCGIILGCNLHSNYHYDGSGNVSYVDYSCDGSARSCDSMSGEESCRSQGCRWE